MYSTVDSAPVPVSVTYYSNPTYASIRTNRLALFAQAQWTVSNLTLNLGVQLETLHAWDRDSE
jgi:outer membrane receptor protein involved in Fe transport